MTCIFAFANIQKYEQLEVCHKMKRKQTNINNEDTFQGLDYVTCGIVV